MLVNYELLNDELLTFKYAFFYKIALITPTIKTKLLE